MIRLRHLFVLVACAAGLAAPRAAAGQTLPDCTGGTNARFVMKFDGTKWVTTPPAVTRITDRDRVEVCVEYFNFLRYTLKFDVKEQQSEAYSYLTKLWSSILNPIGALGAAPPPPPAQPTAIQLLHALYKETRALDAATDKAAAPYGHTGLTRAQAVTLSTDRGTVDVQLATTRKAFLDLDTRIINDVTVFQEVNAGLKEIHRAVVEHFRAVEGRAEVFLRLSGKTIGIEIKPIGKKGAGTRVTFTLVAVDESGATKPMDDVDYFVQSNMPLVAHGGISFSGLKEVSFAQVRRATSFGEEDLFQEQVEDGTTTGFGLFLGWQFYGSGDATSNHRDGKVGLAFSLGTDINDPGERVFAGPSLLLFSRFVITAGAAFGKQAEGGEPVPLEPNLFRIVREKPTAKWFFAISTKVY